MKPHERFRWNRTWRHGLNPKVFSLQGNDHALRYLSLHDNQYLRYLKGHTARVTAVAMSPKNDLFMSAAEVRFW